MRTLVFKLKNLSIDEIKLLKSLQHQGSIDFRKCFNNLELLRDPTFLSSLNIKSSKFKEYLVKEVLTFKERLDSSKERILDKIDELEKINNPKLSRKIIDLKRSYKSNVVFGGRFNLERRRKNLITKEQFRDKRLYPMVFYIRPTILASSTLIPQR